jgi:hypothetical protein
MGKMHKQACTSLRRVHLERLLPTGNTPRQVFHAPPQHGRALGEQECVTTRSRRWRPRKRRMAMAFVTRSGSRHTKKKLSLRSSELKHDHRPHR